MNRLLGTVLSAGVVATAPMAVAQDGSNYAIENDWTYELQLYIWGTDVGGNVLGSDFELGFDQIVDNLNFALMGKFNAYNGPWLTYGELGYANLGKKGSKDVTINPGPGSGITVEGAGDIQMKSTVVSFGGGYQIAATDRYSAYATLGARYLRLQGDVKIDLGDQTRKFSNDDDYWDAVIGVAGRAAFNENWFLSYIADVGAGQSDLTWQAGLGIGYNFGGRHDVVVAYRHMEWDLPDDDLYSEYYQTGPAIIWNIRF